MAFTAKDRRRLQTRMRKVTQRLGQVKNADEEERLLNEQLYLSGALAALDAADGKDSRLLETLKR